MFGDRGSCRQLTKLLTVGDEERSSMSPPVKDASETYDFNGISKPNQQGDVAADVITQGQPLYK